MHVWLSPLPSQGSKEDQAICEQHSELAVKYPLMHAAVNFKDFQYSKASIGKHGKGRYSWLEVWSPIRLAQMINSTEEIIDQLFL